MLVRPKRALPRGLRRSISPANRAFARSRHTRRRARTTERARRNMRRAVRMLEHSAKAARRWVLFGVLIILVGGFIFLVTSPILEVRQIRVQRSELRVDIERVQKVLSPLFERRMLFLTASEVEALLAPSFPDLERVSVSKHYPSELKVTLYLKPVIAELDIEEPPPVQTASGVILPAEVPGKDYLTENGIYVRLPGSFSGVTTISITDWTLRPVPNTELISVEFLQTLEEAEKGLSAALNQEVRKRTVLLRAQEFQLTMQSGITFWFDTKSDVSVQLDRLKVFRQAVGMGEVQRYVDLRLSGRVIFR